jgi:hypothetical protein
MTRLHPRAGGIISWEPDGSPQVMTAMKKLLQNPQRARTEKMTNQATPVTGGVQLGIPLSPALSYLSI